MGQPEPGFQYLLRISVQGPHDLQISIWRTCEKKPMGFLDEEYDFAKTKMVLLVSNLLAYQHDLKTG